MRKILFTSLFALLVAVLAFAMPVQTAAAQGGFWDSLSGDIGKAFDDISRDASETIDRWSEDIGKAAEDYTRDASETIDRWSEDIGKVAEDYTRDASETIDRWSEDIGKAAEDYTRSASETIDDWSQDIGKAAEDYTRDASETLANLGQVVDDTWRDLEKQIPELYEGAGQVLGSMKVYAEEAWEEMPDEAKLLIVEAVDDMTSVTIPVPLKFREDGKIEPGLTFARLSPDSIDIYEPSEREVVTLLTNEAVSTVTHGAIQIDDIETLEVEQCGTDEYKVRIKSTARLFYFIPITAEYEAVVDTETGQVVKSKRPWWNSFAFN